MSKRQALIQTLLGSFSLVHNPSAALSQTAARLKAEATKTTKTTKPTPRRIAIAA